MTRQEFIDDVSSFFDLIMFCQDNGLDFCDDVYDADYLSDIIFELIRDMRDWTQVRDLVKDIPTGSAYYREDGYGSYEDADSYFEDYKNDVFHYMDDNDLWDEEEDEDTEEESDWSIWDAGERASDSEEIETTSFMAVLGRAS